MWFLYGYRHISWLRGTESRRESRPPEIKDLGITVLKVQTHSANSLLNLEWHFRWLKLNWVLSVCCKMFTRVCVLFGLLCLPPSPPLSASVSASLSPYQHVSLPVCPGTCVSVGSFVSVFVCLCVCLSVCLWVCFCVSSLSFYLCFSVCERERQRLLLYAYLFVPVSRSPLCGSLSLCERISLCRCRWCVLPHTCPSAEPPFRIPDHNVGSSLYHLSSGALQLLSSTLPAPQPIVPLGGSWCYYARLCSMPSSGFQSHSGVTEELHVTSWAMFFKRLLWPEAHRKTEAHRHRYFVHLPICSVCIRSCSPTLQIKPAPSYIQWEELLKKHKTNIHIVYVLDS